MAFAHDPERKLKPNPFSATKTDSSDNTSARAETTTSQLPAPCHVGSASDPTLLRCRMQLMSHWAGGHEVHQPSSARRHHASHSTVPKPEIPESAFDQLTVGNRGNGIPENKAPSTLELPKELTQGMQTAWAQSMPRGGAQEQGGLLARKKDGSLAWLPGQGDDAGSFEQHYKDVGPDQTLLASGHTHPLQRG